MWAGEECIQSRKNENESSVEVMLRQKNLCIITCNASVLLVNLGSNEVSGLLDGGDLLSTLLIELDIKLFFKSHHDLNGIKGVGTKVDKLGVSGDLQ